MPHTTPASFPRRSPRAFIRTAGCLLAVTTLIGLTPMAATARTGEPTAGETCPDGKPPGDDGSCATAPPDRCRDGSEPVDGTCPTEEPDLCDDGTEPKDGDCPEPPPTPTTEPCPDGGDFCTQIRSCPIDPSLPPGATCEDAEAPVDAAPLEPAPAVPVSGSVFGRPSAASPAGRPPGPTAPAPGGAVLAGAADRPAVVAGEALARTGATEAWLSAIGAALIAVGGALLHASRRIGRHTAHVPLRALRA